jgi:hypothetical protein
LAENENFVFRQREKDAWFKFDAEFKLPLAGRKEPGRLNVSATIDLKGMPAEMATNVPARRNFRRESDMYRVSS